MTVQATADVEIFHFFSSLAANNMDFHSQDASQKDQVPDPSPTTSTPADSDVQQASTSNKVPDPSPTISSAADSDVILVEPEIEIIDLTMDDDEQVAGNSTDSLLCPICLEPVNRRSPVSTICGHIFCKCCIQRAIRLKRECPMCKKPLPARKSSHDICL